MQGRATPGPRPGATEPLPPGTSPTARVLLEGLRFARALERELAALRPPGLPEDLRGPVPVLPGLAAVHASRGLNTAGGDVISWRRTSPAALIAAGLDPEVLARQALGSAEAWAQGRDPGGIPGLPGWGLVPSVEPPGTLVEVMAGVALSFRMRDQDRVALVVTDAADADSGYWHEGINFAGVQRAPLVAVVHPGRGPRAPGPRPPAVERAEFYGYTATTAPGDDLAAAVDAVRSAVARARSGEGTQVVQVTSEGSILEAEARAEVRLADLVGSSGDGAPPGEDEAATRAREAAAAARRQGPAGAAAVAQGLPLGAPTTPFSIAPSREKTRR